METNRSGADLPSMSSAGAESRASPNGLGAAAQCSIGLADEFLDRIELTTKDLGERSTLASAHKLQRFHCSLHPRGGNLSEDLVGLGISQLVLDLHDAFHRSSPSSDAGRTEAGARNLPGQREAKPGLSRLTRMRVGAGAAPETA